VVGTRNARRGGVTGGAVRRAGTLGGAVIAVAAMAAAVVFGASLTGLVSHPARYGWNWDVLVQAEGSYGNFINHKDPIVNLTHDAMIPLVSGQTAVAGWSEFGFGQLPVDGGPTIPLLGLERHRGAVEPPTTSGRPLSGDDQVELGAVTLRQLGKGIGDTITVGDGKLKRRLTIVGTVTLPSFGVALADHVSLGQGAMLTENTLIALTGAASGLQADVSQPVFPSVAVIDLRPGTTPAQRAALVHRIVSANPDGTDGGTYELLPQLASSVLNAQQLGGQPLALAVGLAAAAGLSLAMTVLFDVRRRRREFAVLKALGMTRGQVRAAVAWQTTLTLLIAVLVGAPLGVAAGRAGWHGFAGSLGVVPFTEIPLLTLIAGLAALIVGGNLLASVPGAIAARTRVARFLRAE
jgi:predicted lysophospholipase L1 biosynthesis ABC-type transport system permease subunit